MAKSFKCTKCNRRFSMAAHLARHTNAMHSRGRRSASKAGFSARRKSTALGFGGGISGGASELISVMQTYHEELIEKRSSLDMEMETISSAMQALGAAVSSSSTRSYRTSSTPVARAGSLKDFIVRVLGQSNKPMSPNEIGTRVLKAGFKTKARDLTKAVSNALPELKPQIMRLGFGQYALSGKK